MSYTISPPFTVNTLNNRVVYMINQTNINTPTFRRRLAYQLFVNGQAATLEESTTGIENVPFPLDFTDVLKEYLKPSLPSFSAAKTEHTDMELEFYLEVWELEYNKEQCETVPTVKTVENAKKLINTTRQEYYDDGSDPYLTSGSRYLVYQPSVMRMCKNQIDFLGVYSSGVTVIFSYYRNNLPLGDTQVVVNKPSSILLNPNAFLAGTEKVEVYIGGSLCHTILVDSCTCEDTQILYQSYAGLYGVMHLEAFKEGLQTTQQETIYSQPREVTQLNNSKIIREEFGTSVLNRQSLPTYSYTKIVKAPSVEDRRKLRDFLSSSKFFIRSSSNSFSEFKKYIPTEGTLAYYEKENILKLNMTFTDAVNHHLPA